MTEFNSYHTEFEAGEPYSPGSVVERLTEVFDDRNQEMSRLVAMHGYAELDDAPSEQITSLLQLAREAAHDTAIASAALTAARIRAGEPVHFTAPSSDAGDLE